MITGTSIANFNKLANAIKIFPNPASKEVYLETSLNTIENIKVINTTGQVIATYKNNFRKIDISQLPKGAYVLEIQTVKGIVTKLFTKK